MVLASRQGGQRGKVRHRIIPLRLSYESLAADPAAALAACCTALGLQPPDTRDVKPGVARLSDQTNLDWTNHYHADLAASG